MTKKALEKLNEKQLGYCATLSTLIERARSKSLREEYERTCGKLRGFLECLCQMEVITGSDLKALYLWFFSGDRLKREEA